ncbi:MAG: hypothetical protein KDK62_06370 [Chlamydiia bacterium]|nr:hypothetical protein [Chlamydiia bacterium]
MEDDELIHLFEQGLIPSEEEAEETFRERAKFCRGIKKRLQETLKEKAPPFLDGDDLFQQAFKHFGINPLWTPVICSNEKLMPWQGASSWIFELEEGDPVSALIQLRGRHLAILGSREEAVTHEAVHIARMTFEEPKYEEVIACTTSQRRFRRFMGPIFRKSAESLTFAALLILIVVFDVLLLFSGSIAWYDRFMWLKLIPLSYFLFLFVRLYFVQNRFEKVKKSVPLPLILLLTDLEIDHFATLGGDQIRMYLKEGAHLSLRRRLMALLGERYGY